MIPPLKIRLDIDKQLEKHTVLENFPIVPEKGDSIWISGIEFVVISREFVTNSGRLNSGFDDITIVLDAKNPEIAYPAKKS